MRREYLLRFDDLSPTMDRARWERFVPLLERHGVKPILAVVPENVDPELKAAPEDAGFWAEMREWQGRGAAIGLHGHRHACVQRGRSLVPLHGETEFAGVEEATQRRWLEAGVAILREHGLEPRLWVGPRHGTDQATVRALKAVGISVISDGLWREPVMWHGAMWIPQQLWEPQETEQSGVWTICLHANTASDALVERLEAFLKAHASEFTTVDRVLEEWPARRFGVSEWAQQSWQLAKLRLRQRARASARNAPSGRV